jgi:imidazolonepropionase-like amidohydrolase
MREMPRRGTLVAIASFAIACGGAQTKPDDGPKPTAEEVVADARSNEPASPIPALEPGDPVLIRDATIMTATGETFERGWIRLKDGRIAELGEGDAPDPADGETVVDAKGAYVTPGLVDTHSHLGVYATPGVWAHADGNEMTNPVTAGVRAEDAFWPQDPGIQRAVGGGVTTIQVLPGSGNLMGGRTVTLKIHPRRDTRAMRFPGAPDGLKMACGENPKRVYGKHKKSMPMSRMGSIYMMRDKWLAAQRYRKKWQKWAEDPLDDKGEAREPPDRDLVLETLAKVLDGEILVHIHCYRADEMLLQLRLAEEIGFEVRSFHHAVEAYKIRDVLAARDVSVSTWADWWGFKIEAYDAVEENLGLLEVGGARPILHTDSPEGIQRMNQEAAKAMYAARAAGLEVTEEDALRWITVNPAWALGIDGQTGTLEKGKMADVVLWDGHPFSVYTRARKVWVDGILRHDWPKGADAPWITRPWSDFEIGQRRAPEGGAR